MTRTKVLRLVAAVAIAATAALGSPAQAAPVDVSLFLVDGTLTIPGLPTGDVVLPTGTGITGTWDDETGAFSGSFDIPNTSMGEVIPDSGICLNVGGSGTAEGTIDPATGAGGIDVSLTITLQLLPCGADPVATCDMGPLAIGLTTDPPGSPMSPMPPAEGSQIGLVNSSPINIPAVTCDNTEAQNLINNIAGLPRQDGSTSLVFEVGQIPEPEPTTTLAPTTAAPAAPAPVAPVQPTFTG